MSSPVSDKRQHIVETAYALFKRVGFHATGIDRIIAEADVAKMTMYRHFPSKDELIVEVLDHRARRFEEQLDRLARESTAPEEKIARIFEWHGRWFRSPDFHGCLFAHALAEFGDPRHPVFKAAARQKNGIRQHMQSILAPVMTRGRAESVAATLLMLIEGATLMAQMGRGDAAIRDARKAALDIVAASRRPQ
ncbi:TetR/AcrR family transcriptional regulator [Mesorhizobium sp. B2-3-4]|uniref:TetR/AcrR family transcriptional regulator n=1 Tax=Mesorhizobium sp. B2-3-4 TaxID=2589959 RepID=UPI001126D10F|nr:TetR/AcrR family transcriptional regulator [Mesorhizobium sp. B2-3-4]TPM39681.1 TetR/AcrR family transcriptional regulator [Mesorhizobium sp. B2-3-4]